VLGTIKAWSKKGAALTKCDKAMKAYDKVIEINSQDSYTWYKKGLYLNRVTKFNI
jgi:hypothetical protein